MLLRISQQSWWLKWHNQERCMVRTVYVHSMRVYVWVCAKRKKLLRRYRNDNKCVIFALNICRKRRTKGMRNEKSLLKLLLPAKVNALAN